MVRRARALLPLAAAVLVAGCAGGGHETAPRLPADRGAPVLYVALGDSTVHGVGASAPPATYVSKLHARLRAVYPNASLVNLGVSGATSADVVSAQLDRALALRPGLVTLSVGPNDITAGGAAGGFARNVDTIFRRLAERRAVVVANLLPDLAVTPRFRGGPEEARVARLTVQFNDALRRTAGEHRVELVDLYGPSRAEVPARPELVAADGYHPSDLGHARWAELVWAGLERRIARP
ncbi:MAG TPA: SGNH/GDSL hydrolase family protein [Methylomirabilota bacterium]|nr:SGNH/GDSL hydrolase family protein [Methylomirabilota bacterium]